MMKQSVNLEDVRARLKQVFGHFPEVRAVFLFGSIAEGRAGPKSDLDLAIIPTGPDLMARQLELLAALVRAGFDRVDLIFLDGRDIVLQFEAVRPNCLIYAREGFDHGAFYSRVVREYLDFLPYLAVQREALKRRLLHA